MAKHNLNISPQSSASVSTSSIMLLLLGGAGGENQALSTPSLDHAFPDTRATTDDGTHALTRTRSRHAHLLRGMVDTLDAAVFDDAVEFMFNQFGEELPQAR